MRVSFAIVFTLLWTLEVLAAPVIVLAPRNLDRRVVKTKPAIHAPIKPAVKPVVKPVTKPIVKPVTPPVAKPVQPVNPPVSKPSVQPITQPVTKPVAEPPVAKPVASPVASAVPNPPTVPGVIPAATSSSPSVVSAATPVGSTSTDSTPVSCPVPPKKPVKQVASRNAEALLVPRRLADVVDAGVANVCKDKVKNIPEFEAITLRKNGGPVLCGAKQQFYDYTDGDATSHLTDTGFNVANPGKLSFVKPPDTTCEHILELNFVKTIMEQPGGVCDQIVAQFGNNPDIFDLNAPGCKTHTQAELDKRKIAIDKRTADIKAAIKPIFSAVNDKALNLVYTQTSLLEAEKTLVMKQAAGQTGISLEINNMASPNTPNRVKAVNDYLTRTLAGKEGPNTLQVARNIDAAIARSFTPTGKTMEQSWQDILDFAAKLP
ncbi:hypothetical protein R3P38DRAFT_3234650 [Favolaschia claudopus]|uniref:Uncharacterized protein n=1 Tax=Favolaschia claudopus TaxID=2862362 RepID=A0AAV9ZFH2_9AGAR